MQWLDDQAPGTLAELLFGIAALRTGQRRELLGQVVDGLMGLFKEGVLPFDTEAARYYADLAVKAKASGSDLPTPERYIAAIAASRGFAVASRHTVPFEAAGVSVLDSSNT